MTKKRAFVKYTKTGQIVPGSLIITSTGNYPKGGPYKEVPIDLCCDPNPCAPTGDPVTIETYTGVDSNQVNFVGGPTTQLFLEIGCGGEGYWSIELTTPPLANITELLDYVNTNLSNLGVFTAEPLLLTGYYNIILNTNQGVLNNLFAGSCVGSYYMSMENYN